MVVLAVSCHSDGLLNASSSTPSPPCPFHLLTASHTRNNVSSLSFYLSVRVSLTLPNPRSPAPPLFLVRLTCGGSRIHLSGATTTPCPLATHPRPPRTFATRHPKGSPRERSNTAVMLISMSAPPPPPPPPLFPVAAVFCSNNCRHLWGVTYRHKTVVVVSKKKTLQYTSPVPSVSSPSLWNAPA